MADQQFVYLFTCSFCSNPAKYRYTIYSYFACNEHAMHKELRENHTKNLKCKYCSEIVNVYKKYQHICNNNNNNNNNNITTIQTLQY